VPSSSVKLSSATTLAVVAVVVPLAFTSGGYSPLAVGTITVVVWLALLARVLGGGAADAARPALVRAAVPLLILLALTVLSVEWTSSDESAFADAVRLAGYLGAFLRTSSRV